MTSSPCRGPSLGPVRTAPERRRDRRPACILLRRREPAGWVRPAALVSPPGPPRAPRAARGFLGVHPASTCLPGTSQIDSLGGLGVHGGPGAKKNPTGREALA